MGSYQYAFRCVGGSCERAAHLGICTFAILLVPCGVAVALYGSDARGAYTLLVAITTSRFALFWFKPAMNQLTQDRVEDDVRGAFAGTKKSLNKAFTVGIAAVAMG